MKAVTWLASVGGFEKTYEITRAVVKVFEIVVNDPMPTLLLARTELIHMVDDVSLTADVLIKAYTSPGAHASVARGPHQNDVIVGARRLEVLARAVLSCQYFSQFVRICFKY